MSLLSDTFVRLFGGKKKHRVRKQPKRQFHLEPLEERQMLSVTNWECECYGECSDEYFDEPAPCPDLFDVPEEIVFEPDFEESDAFVDDAVYGQLTFEDFYQLYHANVNFTSGVYNKSGVYGPITAQQYYQQMLSLSFFGPNGSNGMNGPNGAPQNSMQGTTYNNVYVVDTLLDVVNANDGVTSLREAIALANASTGNTLIEFSVAGTITLGGTALPTMTKSMDILGPGASVLTISGNDLSRIFCANTANTTVTLAGMTLTKGYATSNGGAISFSAADGVLHDVVVQDSETTDSYGGGLYVTWSANGSAKAVSQDFYMEVYVLNQPHVQKHAPRYFGKFGLPMARCRR